MRPLPPVLVAPLLLAAPVFADALTLDSTASMLDEPAAQPRPGQVSFSDNERWTVRIQPRVWFVSPAGDLRLPGTPTSTRPTSLASLNVDAPRLSPYIDLTIREPQKGWFFNVSGVQLSVNNDSNAPSTTTLGTLAITAADRLATNVEWTTFQFTMGRPFPWFPKIPGGDKDNVVKLSWQAGIRTHDQHFTVTNLSAGGTVDSSKLFIEGLAGLKLDVLLMDRFTAEVDTVLGIAPLARSTFSFDIAVGFTYRPTDTLGLHFGYRLMVVDTQSGKDTTQYHYDGSLAGLFAGASIRF